MTITLDALLESIREAVPEDAAPLWLRVDRVDDDLAVALRPDEEGVLGWMAPPECCAIGMVAGGWARGYRPRGAGPSTAAPARPSGASRPAEPTGRIRIALLVDREGRMVSHTKLADGSVIDDPPAYGRVVDTLRRCLALPTEPPLVGSEELLSVLWVARVVDAARRSPGRLRWAQVASLHPAMSTLEASGEKVGAEHVETAMRAGARAWPWERLRLQAAKEGWKEHSLTPELAAWMDEGMFSRWVLEDCPSLDSLLGQATCGLLGAPTSRRLRDVLNRVNATTAA